jgi:hypothetical protein
VDKKEHANKKKTKREWVMLKPKGSDVGRKSERMINERCG